MLRIKSGVCARGGAYANARTPICQQKVPASILFALWGKKSGIKMNGKQTKLCLCVRNCLRQFQSRLLFTRLTIILWTNSLGTTTHQRSLDENQFAQRTFPSNPKRRRRECLQRLHHPAAATREASAENLKLIHQFSPHNLNILCVALHAASVSEIPISKDNFFYKK